jgi:hypothetical protein
MTASPKLNEYERDERKRWLNDLLMAGGFIGQSPCGRVTVALMPEFPGSRMARMSVAYAAPVETKTRRKVGEYWALSRIFGDEWVKVPVLQDVEAMAEFLAETMDAQEWDNPWPFDEFADMTRLAW